MTIAGLPEEELFAQGHRACAGCGQAIAVRLVMKAAGKNTIVANATGCLEVFSTPYPESAWRVPWIHVAFENAAAVASGIAASLKYKGEKHNLLVFGGDGGTFDIGLQALSGAAERGHNFCYVCYDNGAYMNTGIQRSGATPKYASTTTSPAGKVIHGKQEFKKNLPFILAAHKAYVATASISNHIDLFNKVKKGIEFDGPAYIQIDSPCPTGWKSIPNDTVKIAKKAYETRLYPLFEIEGGVLKNLKKPAKKVPVEECLKMQGRFKHLNAEEIKDVQKHIDDEWNRLLKLEESKLKIF